MGSRSLWFYVDPALRAPRQLDEAEANALLSSGYREALHSVQLAVWLRIGATTQPSAKWRRLADMRI